MTSLGLAVSVCVRNRGKQSQLKIAPFHSVGPGPQQVLIFYVRTAFHSYWNKWRQHASLT